MCLTQNSKTAIQVVFIVGPEAKHYHVYKNFACYWSPVFDAAFNGNFKEGESQTYDLPDVRIEVFELFLQWIYQPASARQKNFAINAPELMREPRKDVVSPSKREEFLAIVSLLIDLWAFGDRFLMPPLQNDCLYSLEYIQSAYEMVSLPPNYSGTSNHAEEFVFDSCAWRCRLGLEWDEETLHSTPKDVYKKLFKRMARMDRNPNSMDYRVTDEE